MSNKDKVSAFSLRVDKHLRAKVEAGAEREKRLISDYLRLVIADGVECRSAHRDQAAA